MRLQSLAKAMARPSELPGHNQGVFIPTSPMVASTSASLFGTMRLTSETGHSFREYPAGSGDRGLRCWTCTSGVSAVVQAFQAIDR